jgi:Rap1a immunity proteins
MRNVRNAVLGIALLAQLFVPGSLGTSSAAQEAQSQGDTGVNLLHQCNDAMRFVDGSAKGAEIASGVTCLGYLSGFLDGYTVTEFIDQSRNNFSSSPMCLPDGITAEQGVRIVVKWLTDHPERLHESQRILVMTALVQAFPCK